MKVTLSKNRNLNLNAAFTLIELLIVMVILGILAGTFLANYPRMRLRSRDAQRKSDLAQYATVLENYANKNDGYYPEATGSQVNVSTLCTTPLGLTSCPIDPRDNKPDCLNGLCRYYYQSDGDMGFGPDVYEDATRYTLRARVEERPNISIICSSNVGIYWVICSSGEKGFVCGNTSFSLGACPL